MAFDDRQLDEIRKRVSVSEIVGQRFPLLKKGVEYVVKGNESFTVNDKKGFWCEFGSGGDGKPHDVFDFLQTYEGFTFVGAVEELAKRAGIDLERRQGRPGVPQRNGHDTSEHHQQRSDTPRSKREVVATWDYPDSENQLLYQVVRMQDRMPDGSWRLNKDGKTWKTFLQRRPSPDHDGTWILGLDTIDRESGEPLQFLKLENRDAWMRATEERMQWRNITIRTFPDMQNVEHWLYGANEVLDEMQEAKEDQRIIFMPEGEAKVDVLREWGLLGVTNSGGAKHFTDNCAEFFRNARHVVILQDNDRAGAERVAKVAPMLRAVGVETVQSLNFRDIWTKCPIKGDVKNWRDEGGGTKDKLLEIVDSLKTWEPEPYKSKFGAKGADDLEAPAKQYPWRIKGIIPLNDSILIMGPSRSGKTFETLDMVMHICTGQSTFNGRKIVPGGAVYLAYEGVSGFENRVRAYLSHHHLTKFDLHSFKWLTRPPNLYLEEKNAEELAREIVALSQNFKLPLGVIVIDTHNASTRGSSEIKSDDVGKVMNAHDTIADITGVRPWIVGHTNSEGKHRGNEQLFNAIETSMVIEKLYENNDTKKPERRDNNGSVIRRARMKKQRDGSDDLHWDFVLQFVEVGRDEDNEPIPSFVAVKPVLAEEQREIMHQPRTDRPEGIWLNDTQVSQFQALLRALDEKGIAPPASLQLPKSVDRVVTMVDFMTEWRRKVSRDDNETYEKWMAKTKSSLTRFREKLSVANVIGIDTVDRSTADKKDITFYIWPSGKRVRGKSYIWPRPRPQAAKTDPQPSLLAPGENDVSM